MADLPTFGSGVVPEEVVRAMLLEEHTRLSEQGMLQGNTFQQNWGVDPVYKVGSLNEAGAGPVIDLGATSQVLGLDMTVLGGGQVITTNIPLKAADQGDYDAVRSPTLTAAVTPMVTAVSQPATSYAEATGGFVNGRLGRVFFTSIRNRQITGIRIGTMPMVVMGPGSSQPGSYVPGGGTGDAYFKE